MKHLLLFTLLVTQMPAEDKAVKDEAKDNRKAKIITKLADVTMDKEEIAKQKKQIVDQMSQSIQAGNDTLKARLADLIDDDDQRKEFSLKFEEISSMMLSDFSKRFDQKIALESFVRELNNAMYERYFDEEELIALGKFFSSPVGKKYLKTSPLFLQDVQRTSAEKLNPLVEALMQELSAEYMGKMKSLHSSYLSTAESATENTTAP